jgi:hypothetical protein
MIEVHLVRLESASAVAARDSSQVTEKFNGRRLTCPYKLGFLRTIPVVVGDVRGSLIPLPHERSIERVFETSSASASTATAPPAPASGRSRTGAGPGSRR